MSCPFWSEIDGANRDYEWCRYLGEIASCGGKIETNCNVSRLDLLKNIKEMMWVKNKMT